MTARRDELEPPRLPDALLARALPDLDAGGELDLEGARIDASDTGTAVDARAVDVLECDLTGVTFDAEVLRLLSVRDSVLRTCDLSNVMTRKGLLRRVELRQSRLVGLTLAEGDVEDLRVVGGTMMLASFDEAQLQRVVLEEVNLRDVSFTAARLDTVAFLRCDLTGADFRGAKLRNCLMRGTALDGIAGVASLRGLRMPWPDLVASTGALAGALGISVEQD